MNANAPSAITEVGDLKQRQFLKLTRTERFKSFVWSIVRITLFRWSPPPLNGWRRFLLRIFGCKIHSSVTMAPSTRIEFPWNLNIAKNVVIAHRVIINCTGQVTINAGTLISQYAHLCTSTHDYTKRDMKILRCPISIGKNVWIAADAFVGPNVTIADGSLLAARSSAFHDLPAGQVCIGEPAKPTRPWNNDELNGATGSGFAKPV